jgi:hypothetical protein
MPTAMFAEMLDSLQQPTPLVPTKLWRENVSKSDSFEGQEKEGYDIELISKEIGCDDGIWTKLAQDYEQ